MSLDTIAPALLSDKKFILATDLDGTFLGGTPEARQDLYRWITLNRDSVGLIFVTGRDPHFIEELCTTSIVPWPEYVVGDVGTTIAAVSQETGLRPITELEAPIAEVWQDAGQKVVAKLADWPGLTAQREPFRYRMSYDMDPATFDKGACDLVNEMGLDWLISADRFFDVLPKGVSKGPSLKRLLSHLGVPEHRVL
ncbi:MAG: HAD family hydrolase, partial [Mangrovicoccus sp.]